MIVRRLSALFLLLALLLAALPAVRPTAADPPVPAALAAAPQSDGQAGRGADFLVSTALNYQGFSDVAYNSTDDEYLLVWHDNRKTTLTADVYGQIYSAGGIPQGEPVAIANSVNDEQMPAVAYNSGANEYMVVWADSGPGRYFISGQVLSADGVPMGLQFFVEPFSDDHHMFPDLVYDPIADHYLVTWENLGDWDTNIIEGQLLDASGGSLLPAVIPISAMGTEAKVAYNSSSESYLVVYRLETPGVDGDIYGQVIAADGSLAGGWNVICADPAEQYKPDLAYNSHDNQYLVVWEDLRHETLDARDVYGQVVNEFGNPFLGSDIPISTFPNPQSLPRPAYNPDLNQYLVVWSDDRDDQSNGYDIWGVRVRADGTLADQGNFHLSNAPGDQFEPITAYSTASHQYLVAWSDRRSNEMDIYGLRLNGLGFPLGAEFGISAAEEAHEEPDVAFNSDDHEYLVVWADGRSGDGTTAIWAQRYDRSGRPLGQNFAVREEGHSLTAPVVTYNLVDNNYLVVWEDIAEEDVEGQLVSAQGSLLGFAFNVSEGNPSDSAAVAFNYSLNNYLVVYRCFDAVTGYDICGREISAEGQAPDHAFPIRNNEGDQGLPDVAYDPTDGNYVVVWQSEQDDEGDVYARLVGPAGGGVGGVYLVEQAADAQTQPVIAWNSSAGEFLVVWTDYRDSGISGADLYGRRLAWNGAPIGDSFAISTAAGDQSYPYVSFIETTNQYYTGWQDNRDGGTGWDLYGRWVNADGSLGSVTMPLFTYSGWQMRPAGANDPEINQGLVVWQDGRNGATYEIYGRFGVQDLEPPTASFTRDPTVGQAGTTFTFDARSSSDNATPAGLLLVRWDWTSDGTWDTLPSLDKVVTQTVVTPGVYTVTLGVWDLMLLSDTVAYPIFVLPASANTPPTASLAITPSLAAAGTTFTFDASASTDAEDPADLQARWDWENDGTWDTAWGGIFTPTHAYTVAGDYTARVEVRDPDNLTDAAVGNLTVVPGEPVQLAVDPAAVLLAPGEVFQFRAAAWDTYANGMANPAVAWSVADPSAGTIDASGVFTASQQSGTYTDTVHAQIDGLTDTASVTIYQIPTYAVYLPIVLRDSP
jgi:hypothetical protein